MKSEFESLINDLERGTWAPKSGSVKAPAVAAKGIPSAEPDAWREDFGRWRGERCVSRLDHEDSQSVGSLLSDFGEWCIGHDAVPADKQTFEALLQDAEISIKNGLAIGIVLKADLESVLKWPKQQPSTQQAETVRITYYPVPLRKPGDEQPCALYRGLVIAGRRQW